MPGTYTITVGAPTTFYFGDATVAGAAGVNVGVAGITISSGNGSGHWTVANSGDSTLISPSATGDTANLNAGPYTLILSNGNTVVINIVSNATSLNSYAALKTKLQAGVAYGHQLLMRSGGSYSSGGEDIVPVHSGTWIAPANYSDAVAAIDKPKIYPRGRDLSTGNHIRIRPHTGEVVTFTARLQIKGTVTNGFGRIRISNIIFNVTDAGSITEKSATGMYQPMGATDMAVDFCTFQALNSVDYGHFERRPAIYAPSSLGILCHGLIVQDSVLNDCYNGIIVSKGDDICLVGNTIRRAWNDGFKYGTGNRNRICWNFIVDKLKPPQGTGVHPDFAQCQGAGATVDCEDMVKIGNVIVRGQGSPGLNDGQGDFNDDLGVDANSTNVWKRPINVGNRILCGYANGISYGGSTGRVNTICDGAFGKNNTVLNDPTSDGIWNETSIKYINGINTAQEYNLQAKATVPTGDISAPNLASYDTHIVGGQGAMGAGVGSTLAQVVAATNIKAGSPCDLASPKVGAHQDYFNYETRTITLPYAIPYPPA